MRTEDKYDFFSISQKSQSVSISDALKIGQKYEIFVIDCSFVDECSTVLPKFNKQIFLKTLYSFEEFLSHFTILIKYSPIKYESAKKKLFASKIVYFSR